MAVHVPCPGLPAVFRVAVQDAAVSCGSSLRAGISTGRREPGHRLSIHLSSVKVEPIGAQIERVGRRSVVCVGRFHAMTLAKKRPTDPERRYHHGDLRRALVDAALALIVEGELGTFSLREVARRAGVTPAAPYHHFKDKTALLAAVAEEGFVALRGRLEAALAPVPPADVHGRFGALARAYLEFARAHPAHYRVMFLPDIKSQEEHASFHAAADRTLEVLAQQVREAAPQASPREVMTRTVLIWSIGHGLASLWNDGVLDHKLDPGSGRAFLDATVEQIAAFASGVPASAKSRARTARRR
jgi:AcrR family transcriptional regulator